MTIDGQNLVASLQPYLVGRRTRQYAVNVVGNEWFHEPRFRL